MATRIFREISDFEYELLMSAKEAIETLLEVVRKPISTYLQDDKERNAVKAKRECFDDAKYLMTEVKQMLNAVREDNPDVAEHVNQSAFKGGLAERFAEKVSQRK
jgi:CHASE3 domain sensor protein